MYRKFTADHIFDGYTILPSPAVLVTQEDGLLVDIIDPQDAGEGIETFKGLLCPGFVNAHCHLELSHLKGVVPEKTGLVNFVQQVMSKRAASNEVKQDAMLEAVNQMYNAGIIAVGDICNTPDSIPVKVQSPLQWHNFIEVSGFVDETAARRFDEMANLYASFKNNPHLQRLSFSPMRLTVCRGACSVC